MSTVSPEMLLDTDSFALKYIVCREMTIKEYNNINFLHNDHKDQHSLTR